MALSKKAKEKELEEKELNVTEFFTALSLLSGERGITADYLIDKIKAAIVIAVKKNFEVEDDNVLVTIDPALNRFDVALVQDIVADEDWENEHTQIPLSEALRIKRTYEVGMRVTTPLKTKEFGRIAAQTAKHVIRQGIREAERSQQLSEIQSKAHDIVLATVTRVDTEKGIVALDLGKGGEAILPRNEQVPGESYTEGQQLQVYVVDVLSGERGARVMISRTHPGLVKRLFELEVPEIFNGTVEVKAISREAGARTKMAVWSKDTNVNPVSACIGEHGARVAAVVEKLGGEKIDIVKWSEDVSEFISAALSPAKVLKVELLPGETRSCRVTVPDQQLSLAIGNKGQNARLCARLTGYNIDIRPESGYYGEDEEPKAEQPDAE
ncbi:MAG: transcription termination factor NusA [Faecalibacterium sp.]